MNLFLFPFNGNALEALDIIPERRRVKGFIDDDLTKKGEIRFSLEIFDRSILRGDNFKILAVPGSPKSFLSRMQIINSLQIKPESFLSVISSSAFISSFSETGTNSLIMENTVIKGGCSVGDHVIIRPCTVISHDSKIGDYTIIGSNVSVSGSVSIGQNCYIGAGAVIREGVTIGAGSLIGAGAVVIRDVPAGSVAVGVPARFLNT